MEDGNKINALLFKTPSSPKGLIIYFHGNADNLARWGQYAEDFTTKGYNILMMDYRGYGKSTGSANEYIFYDDAKSIWNWVLGQFPDTKYIIYGRSLGTAIATDLASKVEPTLLILETPFDEIKSAYPSILKPVYQLFPLKYKFSNIEKLQDITCQIIIFHGTKDAIVPYSSTIKLKPFLKEKDLFITIPKGKHRNLRTFSLFHEKLSLVLDI